MKHTLKSAISLLLAALFILCAVSCGGQLDTEALWQSATHTSDATLGEGENTVKIEIAAGEKAVTLTIKTDKATLGEALYEHQLVNDPLFFDVCNGIKADWDKDSAYWAFYVNGESAMYGIGDEKAVTTADQSYKLIYTK